MGLFDRIKEVFAKSSLESIQDLEKDLQKLQGKAIFSDIVAIIGTGGRLKGLPLIFSAKDEKMLKILVARISEIINPVQDIDTKKELVEINLVYKGLYIILISIKQNISFLGVSPIMEDIEMFRDWIKKNSNILTSLFSD